ncbi:unnamed protein product [Parajaminaea phylloscopi]
MDYLRSAASAVLSKSSGPLPNYTIGAPVQTDLRSSGTIWQLHQGTKRDDGSACSILVFDAANDPNGKTKLTIARNAARKLRTLRHPDVIKLLDSAETPTAVYIAVEPVRQLGPVLEGWTRDGGTQEGKLEWIAWGLSRVANALKFINVDAGAIHGNVRPESILLSQAGEWRLAGFELLTAKSDHEGVIWNLGGIVPDAALYASPEVRQGGWRVLHDNDTHSLDAYSFALLCFSVYNGLVPTSNTTLPPQGSVQPRMYALLRRMLAPTPNTRLSIAQLVEAGNTEGSFWRENRLAKLSEEFDGFMLISERERNDSIRSLQTYKASLPVDFLSHKILPSLVHALNLSYQPNGSAQGSSLSNAVHAPSILPLVLQLGSSLPDNAWNSAVLPSVLKAYTSPDRSVRITLLDTLPEYLERVDSKKVSESIWPNIVTGFADSSAAIREGTLKAVLPLSSKLTDRIRNNELLRQLAKTQVDVEPSIRTNTTILLGRLAPSLNVSTRKGVLIPAFSRSLKDPFVHARVAGLMALMATSESYDKDDLAKSVLPALCPTLVDKEKLVRDQAEKALEVFWARIRDEVKSMPDSVLPPPSDAMPASHAGTGPAADTSTSLQGGQTSGSVPGGLASTAGGAASALAGWAMSGAMSYLASGNTPAASQHGATLSPSSMAGSMDNKRPPLLTGSSASSEASFSSLSMNEGSKAHVSSSSKGVPAALRPEWADSGNLIDMDDDTADWTSFESAPAKKPLRRTTPGRAASSSSPLAAAGLNRKIDLGTRVGHASQSKRNMSSTGAERLKMGSGAGSTDDAAWGGDDSSWNASETPKAAVSSATAAFTTPVPAWDASQTTAPVAEAQSRPSRQIEEWSNDFADDDEARGGENAARLSAAAPVALSKEDKRAQMERQREERRERMRKLKESKGKKLGDSLA